MKVLIAVAVAMMSLAGCGDKPPAVKAGTCIGKEIKDTGDRVPDLSSVVPCSEPHAYEITAVVDLPAAVLTGSSKAELLANRADLAAPKPPKKPTSQRKAFERFANKTCTNAGLAQTGLDTIRVDGKSAADAQVYTLVRYINFDWHSVTPVADWLDGKRQLVCSNRFTADQGFGAPNEAPTKPMASPHGKPIGPTLLTSTFLPDWRQCDAYNQQDEAVRVDCSKPHFSELAFAFNAEPVFGTKYVEANDFAGDDADWAKLDAVCAASLKYYLASDWDWDVLKAYGDTGTFGWGEKGADFYPVMCKVVAAESKHDLPGGSLVDQTGNGLKLIKSG